MSFISLPPVCLIPRSQVQSHIVKKKKKEKTVALDQNSKIYHYTSRQAMENNKEERIIILHLQQIRPN